MGESSWRMPSMLPLALVAMAGIIIIAGGTIRILDAGESCPDWPKCFGKYTFVISEEEQEAFWEEFPEHEDSRGIEHRYTVLEIFSEWIHRLLAAIIAIPVLINFLMVYKMREKYGQKVLNTSIAVGVLLILQAAAGAVTVVYDNVDWSVALHLSMATIFTATIVYQYLQMKVVEGSNWSFIKTSKSFLQSSKKRFYGSGAAVFILMILGAWVSSTAGGNYNQACSIGFPDGWPACRGSLLPNLKGEPGVIVQMVHRFGAVIVGALLVINANKMRLKVSEFAVAKVWANVLDFVTGFWILNVAVGGSYIIFANDGDFPEWLSLLHLVIGVSAAITGLLGIMFHKIASDALTVAGDSGVEEDE